MQKTYCSLLIGVALLAGCQREFPKDLTATLLQKQSRDDIAIVVGEDSTLPLLKSWAEGDFVVVTLSTKEDVWDQTRARHFTLFVDAEFCDDDAPVLLASPDVYQNGISLSRSIQSPIENSGLAKNDGDDVNLYQVVLFESWTKDREVSVVLRNDESQRLYTKYDLNDSGSDVCISLGGSDMVRSFRSNVVRLSAESLASALR